MLNKYLIKNLLKEILNDLPDLINDIFKSSNPHSSSSRNPDWKYIDILPDIEYIILKITTNSSCKWDSIEIKNKDIEKCMILKRGINPVDLFVVTKKSYGWKYSPSDNFSLTTLDSHKTGVIGMKYKGIFIGNK